MPGKRNILQVRQIQLSVSNPKSRIVFPSASSLVIYCQHRPREGDHRPLAILRCTPAVRCLGNNP
jgi:hypothetical protein